MTQRMVLPLLLFSLLLPACQFMEMLPQGQWMDKDDGNDSVVPVESTTSSMQLAHQSILEARPAGIKLLTDKIDLALPGFNIGEHLVEAVGVSIEQDSHNLNTEECPYLEPIGGGDSTACNSIVALATDAAELSQTSVAGQILNQVVNNQSLTDGELAFVNAWTQEAVSTGIVVGGIESAGVLQSLSICDQDLNAKDRAFALGEEQGRALIYSIVDEILEETPESQCNTDLIALSVKAEAEQRAVEFNESNPICGEVSEDLIVVDVDLDVMDRERQRGVQQGIENGYEVIRVKLVEEWECDPDAPTEECLCYARYWGDGPVYCFYESAYDREPMSGWELEDMAERGVPQCQGDDAVPVGSPLVFDLDLNGVQLSTRASFLFDLAATGEPVRVPALEGMDVLLTLDLDGNGLIESGAELFGNNTQCGERRCSDGILALAQYDENQDGLIDARDPVFGRLRLWQDVDLDGQSQAHELWPLSAAHIEHVSLQSRLDLAWVDGHGNSAMRAVDFKRSDGKVGQVHDVWFGLSFEEQPRNPRTTGIVSDR